MELTAIIQNIRPLPDPSLQKLVHLARSISLPKGHHLFHAGRCESSLYFIGKGIARAYCYQADTEVTFWFGREGNVVFSYNSLIHQKPGYEHVELLEEGRLHELRAADLLRLYEEDIHLANWGRTLAEHELIRTEERLISRQFKTALERYNELQQQDPDLLRRVSLGHIASYLGVTQVTLSRIRAERKG